jgi:sugar lactone lactonase YvrE
LQFAAGPALSGNGPLIRVDHDGTCTTIASDGLLAPTSVAINRDGRLYVSNRGIFPSAGDVLWIEP